MSRLWWTLSSGLETQLDKADFLSLSFTELSLKALQSQCKIILPRCLWPVWRRLHAFASTSDWLSWLLFVETWRVILGGGELTLKVLFITLYYTGEIAVVFLCSSKVETNIIYENKITVLITAHVFMSSFVNRGQSAHEFLGNHLAQCSSLLIGRANVRW